MSNERVAGIVRSFNLETGNGVIEQENGGQDVLVNFRNIESEGFKVLNPGERVTFIIRRGNGTLHALEVRKV